MPVYQYDESIQVGSNFSERLTNSIEDLFQKGFNNVITVGSDSPQLLDIDFSLIQTELEKGNVILGPTQRGGAYLIAIPFKSWNRKDFKEIPWNTNRVFESLKDLYQGCVVKSRFTEIHTYKDIITVIKKGCSNDFVLQLKRLLNLDYYQPNYSGFYQSEIFLIKSERGPPLPVSLHF
nr:DUF2064 domain-containing protein [Mangrovivirga halotolerans]